MMNGTSNRTHASVCIGERCGDVTSFTRNHARSFFTMVGHVQRIEVESRRGVPATAGPASSDADVPPGGGVREQAE
jgi:hypothetical protein